MTRVLSSPAVYARVRLTDGTQAVQKRLRLVRVKSYAEAVRLARCAGEDAANRRMRKAGRKAWSAADHDHAADVTEAVLVDLGFDLPGWLALAGVPRNEPPAPKPAKKPRRRSAPGPVQLSFAFA